MTERVKKRRKVDSDITFTVLDNFESDSDDEDYHPEADVGKNTSQTIEFTPLNANINTNVQEKASDLISRRTR